MEKKSKSVDYMNKIIIYIAIYNKISLRKVFTFGRGYLFIIKKIGVYMCEIC